MQRDAELTLETRCLLLFCRRPGTADYPMSGVHFEPGKELDRLFAVFPDVQDRIAGKRVIDFGCGFGYQAVALARAGAAQVLGVEIDETGLNASRERAARLGLASTVAFEREIPNGFHADVIISQNTFEHFLEPEAILRRMSDALCPNGQILVTFAPPWNAPWGAHMAYFCKLPWVQLIFSEKAVMQARSFFRPGRESTYKEVGLGQISLAQFERVVAASGLRVERRQYDCVRRLDLLARTPLRELFVNRVSCVLTRN